MACRHPPRLAGMFAHFGRLRKLPRLLPCGRDDCSGQGAFGLYPYGESPRAAGARGGPARRGELSGLARRLVTQTGQDVGQVVLDRNPQAPARFHACASEIRG